ILKWAALAGLGVLVVGCGGHARAVSQSRAVLYKGVGPRHPGTAVANRRVSDAAARRGGARLREGWERQIRSRAIESPREHFANLLPETLKKRLAEAAHDHGFQVASIKLLRAGQPRSAQRPIRHPRLELRRFLLRSTGRERSAVPRRLQLLAWAAQGRRP